METLSLLGVAAIILAAFAYALWPLGRPALAGGNGEADAAGEEIAKLLFEREQTYRNIRDIDMDREMGKLSEEDYEEMIGRARAGALDVLRRLEARGVKEGMVPAYLGEGEAVDAALDPKMASLAPVGLTPGEAVPGEAEHLDERLEAEILRHRKVSSASSGVGEKGGIQSAASSGEDEMGAGGIEPDSTGVGFSVGIEKVNFCPKCGERAGESHNFCASCGNELK